nr:hypothetical protein Iba_chr04aCG15990 [Ipomoea batatas]GMC82554.1 hypothetical protein Iba_chr04bCG14460 [Ipomoea batatas]
MTASVGCGGISRLRRPSPASDVQQRQLPQRQRSLFPSLALGDPNPSRHRQQVLSSELRPSPSLDKGDGESDPWWSRAYRRQRRRGGFLPLFSEVRDLLKATVESDTIFNRGGARVLSRPLMSAADTVRVGVFGPVGESRRRADSRQKLLEFRVNGEIPHLVLNKIVFLTIHLVPFSDVADENDDEDLRCYWQF